jgi:hypothetical protein
MNEIPLPQVLEQRVHSTHDTLDMGEIDMPYDERVSARCLYVLLLTCAALEVAEQLRYGEFQPQNVRQLLLWHVKHSIQQLNVRNDALDGSDNSEDDDECSADAERSRTDDEPELTRGWLCDARAQEMLRMVLQLATHPDLCLSVETAVNGWFGGGERFFDSRSSLTLVFGQIFELQCTMQPAMVACVLRGLVVCASQGLHVDADRSAHSGTVHASALQSSSSSSSSGRTNSHNSEESVPTVEHTRTTHSAAVPQHLLPLQDFLTSVLQEICATVTTAAVIDVIGAHFSAIVAVPVGSTVQAFLLAILPLCTRSPQLLGCLHGYLQKRVQSTDVAKQLSAVRVLVPLLFVVPSANQLDVGRTILFVFTRSAVVSREAYILLLLRVHSSDLPLLSIPVVTLLRDALSRDVAQHFRSATVLPDSQPAELVYDPSLRIKQIGPTAEVEDDIEHSMLLLFRLEMVGSDAAQGTAIRKELQDVLPSVTAGSDGVPLEGRANDDGEGNVGAELGFPHAFFQSSYTLTLIFRCPSRAGTATARYIRAVLKYAAHGFSCAGEEAQVSDEVLLCRLGSGYTALSAVLHCALAVLDLKEDSSWSAIESLLALLELVQSLAAAISNGEISTHSGLRAMVFSKLSGQPCEPHASQAQRKPAAKVDGQNLIALAAAVPAPLAELTKVVEHCGRRSETCPTSVATGMVGTLGSLVHAALLYAKDMSDASQCQGLLEKLLQLYHTHGAISNEDHVLTTEEEYYRQYVKQQRRASSNGGHSANRFAHMKRRRRGYTRTRRNVRRTVRRSGEEEPADDDDGFIDSGEDDCNSGSDLDEGDKGEGAGVGSVPKGFTLDFLRGSALTRRDHEHIDDAGSAKQKPRDQPSVVLIGSAAAEDDEGEAGPRVLPCCYRTAVLGLSERLQTAFQRWDVHVHSTAAQQEAHQDKRLSVAALHTEIRSVLFGARSELLLSIAACVELSASGQCVVLLESSATVMSRLTSGLHLFAPVLYNADGSVASKSLMEMGQFFAQELSLSLQRGVMIRTFNVSSRFALCRTVI